MHHVPSAHPPYTLLCQWTIVLKLHCQTCLILVILSMNGVLEFYDTSDVVCMNQAEHFMATDVEWDPTGRYVATSVSWWAHKVSTTFHFFECASEQSFFNGEHKVPQDPKT